jgi:hypothetical protein
MSTDEKVHRLLLRIICVVVVIEPTSSIQQPPQIIGVEGVAPYLVHLQDWKALLCFMSQMAVIFIY